MSHYLKRICKDLILVLLIISSRAWAQKSGYEGATSEEGWIVKRTKNGIIKIPKKQIFKFGETGIEGSEERPAESLFKPRNRPDQTSLIPERKSYKRELMYGVANVEARSQ